MITHEVPDLSHIFYSLVVPYISHVSGITGCNFSWLSMNVVQNYWVQFLSAQHERCPELLGVILPTQHEQCPELLGVILQLNTNTVRNYWM